MWLSYAVDSDTGRTRQHNEDSAFASPRLIAVADGMGGHAHGEVASAFAVAALADLDDRLTDADLSTLDLPELLTEAVVDASQRMTQAARHHADLRGMGSTLTAMLFDGTDFTLAHIGDSRGYLLRDGELRQLTHDHTLVQEMIDDGRMDPEQAADHPRRSVLTRALHTGGITKPDLSTYAACPGDRYLLCSDGLTGVVGPEQLHEVLANPAEPADLVPWLIDLANEGGGPDNITCAVVDVVEATDAAPEERTRIIAGAAATQELPTGRSGGSGWLPRWARRLRR
ncbi:protein phosphatase [Goodfellowiella coeruleoviolacea]|uniref:Protein phosphatase n=2 Tax=Goodfellowiella coeruleoviolacea TaxID=334858 RepID=A0AAE3GEL9_9PSEU|nr:protein phosphatase [Goodfellowiella coeruleoviolacea]